MAHDRRTFLRTVGAGSIALGASPLFTENASAADIITMTGGGYDIWSTRDEFHFYYAEVTGGFDVVVRNTYIEDTSDYAKAGIMARASLADDAKNVMLRHVPSNNAALQWRPETGGSTVSTTSGGDDARRVSGGYLKADWLRLTRSGDRFEALGSTDGTNWTVIGVVDDTRLTLPETVYLGLPVTSHAEGTLATARYTGLSGVSPTANRDVGDPEVSGGVSVETGVPIVSAGEATDVTAVSATLHGSLDDLGEAGSAAVAFEYREADAEAWTTTASTTRSSLGAFDATVLELTPQETYEYRAVVDAADGDSATSQTRRFETPSIVRMESVEDVTADSATFRGAADLRGIDTATVSFEYRELNTDSWTATAAETLDESGSFAVEADGLPSRRYIDVRAVIEVDGAEPVTSEPTRFSTPSHANGGPPAHAGPSSASSFDVDDGFADAGTWLDHDTPVVRVRKPTREQLERALTVDGERLVVFETSGTIDLDSGFGVTSDKLYVAGQTAPSPGISLVKGGLFLDADDVVLQHVRVCRGDDTDDAGAGDAISTSEDRENIVYDHVTAMWGTDETLSLSDGVRNSTMSNCVVGEALRNSEFHSGGNGHSAGSLIGSGYENVSLMGNLWASNLTRNPRLQSGTSAVVNNVSYDFRNGAGCSGGATASIVGNAFIRGAVDAPAINMFDPHDGEIYATDNYTRPDEQTVVSSEVNRASSRPVWPSGLEALPATETEDHVVANAGARPADRTYHDRRLFHNVVNWEATGGDLPGDSGLDHAWIDHEEAIGGYPDLAENTRELEIPESGTWPWIKAHARRVEVGDDHDYDAYLEAEGAGTVDGFEDGDLSEYVGSRAEYVVTDDAPVPEGAYSLKNTSGGDGFLVSYADLPRYPMAGDAFTATVAPTDETAVMGVAFGVKSEENCYFLRYWPGTDTVQLYKVFDDEWSDPTYEKLAESGTVGGVTVGEAYEYVVDWGADGHIEVDLEGPSGNPVASLTADDSTHRFGGVGTRRSGVLDDIRLI